MSVAYLQHPMIFTTPAPPAAYQYPIKQQQFVKQKQCLLPRRNYQQMMWHARSMESGLGKSLPSIISFLLCLFVQREKCLRFKQKQNKHVFSIHSFGSCA